MAEINCTDNNLSAKDYLKGVLGKDGNGNCAIRLKSVDDGNAPVQDCNLKNISALEMLKMILEFENGKLAIRVINGTDSGEQCLNCDNNFMDLDEILLNELIGMASDGRPALRLIS